MSSSRVLFAHQRRPRRQDPDDKYDLVVWAKNLGNVRALTTQSLSTNVALGGVSYVDPLTSAPPCAPILKPCGEGHRNAAPVPLRRFFSQQMQGKKPSCGANSFPSVLFCSLFLRPRRPFTRDGERRPKARKDSLQGGTMSGMPRRDRLGTAEHYPKLAGQSAAYIRKQLGDFHAGARKSEIMNAMAPICRRRTWPTLPPGFPPRRAGAANSTILAPPARRSFSTRSSPRSASCASCHGEKALLGSGPTPVPASAASTNPIWLTNFTPGADDRKNSPGDVMNDIARRLSEAEIDALAGYLSGLRRWNERHRHLTEIDY